MNNLGHVVGLGLGRFGIIVAFKLVGSDNIVRAVKDRAILLKKTKPLDGGPMRTCSELHL